MLARVLLTALLTLPALDPGDLPVCGDDAPPEGVVYECVQPQLPEETTGRELGDGTDPAPSPAEPADPAPARPAYTG